MSQEIETAAAGSIGSFFQRTRKAEHAVALGTPCANCGTALMGPWCHACGQLGEDFHRSVWKLVVEVFEGLLHFDSRVWRTVPDLMLHPGRLTRRYLEGHRAPQIPPLRLFLVVLLLLFFAGSLGGSNIVTTTTTDDHGKLVGKHNRGLKDLTPKERAEVQAEIAKAKVYTAGSQPNAAVTAWLRDRAGKAVSDPERFTLLMEQWSERFAFLMLPIAAALLSLLFVFQRRFFIFDHTIFALHSLSATGLVLSLSFLLRPVIGELANLLWLALPAHLFRHMRGVYGTSVFGTLVRMALLFVGSLIGFSFIVVGLVAVALNGLD